MSPKGHLASVLFYFAIAVTLLAMGRVSLRAPDYMRTRTSSNANSWRSKVTPTGPDVLSLQGLTAELKPGPPALAHDQKTLIAKSRGCEPTAINAVGGRGGVNPGCPEGKVLVRIAATSFDAVSTTNKMSPPGVSAQVTGACPA